MLSLASEKDPTENCCAFPRTARRGVPNNLCVARHPHFSCFADDPGRESSLRSSPDRISPRATHPCLSGTAVTWSQTSGPQIHRPGCFSTRGARFFSAGGPKQHQRNEQQQPQQQTTKCLKQHALCDTHVQPSDLSAPGLAAGSTGRIL